MEENSLPPVVVLDNGSGYLKAGFSNQKSPEICIPALVGRQLLRYGEKIETNILEGEGSKYKEIMIGDEVIPFRSLLELTYPIDEGIIRNPDDLFKLWEYAITNKLKIEDPSESKILVTEAPLNPISNKKTICEILFEQLGVKAMNIEAQAKCSLFCEGIDSGVVLDSGDGVTHCIPISDGNILRYNIERLDIAGRHITQYLIRLLQRKGYSFNSSADFEFVRYLKEKYCFVSNDIENDRKLERETTYYNSFHLLPDETRIHISDEKFEAPEILFSPYLIGSDVNGIPEMMFKSINNCPIDLRKNLYGNLILSGATTLFPGFATRLELEMKKLYKENNLKMTENKKIKISINVIDSPKRKYSVFIGATIIANYYNRTNDDDNYWITREEWLDCEDKGSYTKENLIKNKCQSYLKDKGF
jgi:actin-related protein 2